MMKTGSSTATPSRAKEIVRGKPMVAPATGCHYVDVLEKAAPRNESKEAASAKK
jgi:hypothetical protein